MADHPRRDGAGSGDDGRLRRRRDAHGTNSAEAYDSATVFLAGVDAGKTRRRDMEAFVDHYSGTGVTAPIRFKDNGELVDSSVSVWSYRVHDGQIVPDKRI